MKPRRSRRLANQNNTRDEHTPQWSVGQALRQDEGEEHEEGFVLRVVARDMYWIKWKNGMEEVLHSNEVEEMVTYQENFIIKFNKINEEYEHMLLLEAAQNQIAQKNVVIGEEDREEIVVPEVDEEQEMVQHKIDHFQIVRNPPYSISSDASSCGSTRSSSDLSLCYYSDNNEDSASTTSDMLWLCDIFRTMSLRECHVCREERDDFSCTFCILATFLDNSDA